MSAKPYVFEFGMGVDVHGLDATTAACRAVSDAIRHSTLPFFRDVRERGGKMLVDVTVGVPDPTKVDVERVRKELPHGEVTVRPVAGGLRLEDPPVAIAAFGIEHGRQAGHDRRFVEFDDRRRRHKNGPTGLCGRAGGGTRLGRRGLGRRRRLGGRLGRRRLGRRTLGQGGHGHQGRCPQQNAGKDLFHGPTVVGLAVRRQAPDGYTGPNEGAQRRIK